MTNFERIKQMSKEELAGFLETLIIKSIECGEDKDLECHKCVLFNICGRELEYLREEY